jgi:signal transduction histidine kinase
MKQDAVQPELQKEGLEVIERNARAQSNLIADLLDISRIVAGKLRLEPRAFNFVACLESAINNVRPLATEKAVQVVNSVDSALLPRIACMETRSEWNRFYSTSWLTPSNSPLRADGSKLASNFQAPWYA